LLIEPALGLDVLGQRSTVTELIDEVVVVGGAEHFQELDDVEVVDLGEDGDLVVGELAEFGRMLELLHIHHFYREDLLVFTVFGLVDVPVLALTYLLKQDVILNNLVHFTCILIAKLYQYDPHCLNRLFKKSNQNSLRILSDWCEILKIFCKH
jgi:hypothetical protein